MTNTVLFFFFFFFAFGIFKQSADILKKKKNHLKNFILTLILDDIREEHHKSISVIVGEQTIQCQGTLCLHIV